MARESSDGWRLRSIFGGSVGNLVEWYDWFAYSAFALYFAAAFFPEGDQTAQLLSSAAVFAVGFLMRPIGGWLMGIYADRAGRRAALMMSMLLMGLGSLAIGLTPGYDRIGLLAPIALVLARMVQGLSIGGEYGAAATYLSEIARRRYRGFWSSFQYVTLIMGQLLALALLLLLQQVLTAEELQRWGWRIPFFIGALCALLALWIRRGISESAVFEAAAVEQRAQIASWRLLAQHRREVAIVIGLTIGGGLAFYTFSTYMQKFLANTSGFDKSTATQIMAAAMVVFMLLQPLMGWLSDLVGRRALLILFGVLGVVSTVPLMTAIGATRDPFVAFVLVCATLTIASAYTAISGLFKAELFPTAIRAFGVALPYAIAHSVFGGTAELIALSLKKAGRETWFYWYVTAAISIALLTALLMRDTKRHSRIVED